MSEGIRKGEHRRYIHGHRMGLPIEKSDGPNPSGVCMCGCGEETPLATVSRRRTGDIKGTPKRFVLGHSGRLNVRFRQQPIIEDSGCWRWPAILSNNRASHVRDGDRRLVAYRWMYEEEVRPIPEGHDLHHLCDNGTCVNPNHLVPMLPEIHRKVHSFKKALRAA